MAWRIRTGGTPNQAQDRTRLNTRGHGLDQSHRPTTLLSEVVDVKKKRLRTPLLALLLIALLASSAWTGTESDCRCHDRPDFPCVRQEITLENIEFPITGEKAKISLYYERLEAGDSEVWLLIETVPAGACGECAQTYVLFAPKRDVGDWDYRLFNETDPRLTASRVVFSMIECYEASELSMRMAIVTEDDYDETMELLAPFVRPDLKQGQGLLLAATGDREESEAEDSGWSVRLQGAWLDSLFDRVTQDEDNKVVLPITPIKTSPTMDNVPSERNVMEDNAPATGWIAVKLRGNAYSIGCSLRCSKDAPPTDAEKHLKGRQLCELATFATTASPGFTSETAPGKNLPANAAQQTSVHKTTYKRSDGATVEVIVVVRVIQFGDDSHYLESYTLYRVTTKDGKVQEYVRDCLQSAWLLGSDSARLRALLETYKAQEVVHQYTGGSPSNPLTLPDAVDWTGATGGVPDEIRITVPSGTALDLTAFPTGTGPFLVARESITIRADTILSPEGATLESLMSPSPRLMPGVDELTLVAPEVVSVSTEPDILGIVVANQSSDRETVSLGLSDTQGWVLPETRELSLAAGQAAAVWIHVSAGSEGTAAATSVLTVTASSERLGDVRELVELRLVSPTPVVGASEGTAQAETGSPAGTTVTPPSGEQAPQQPSGTAQISVPQDITSCARTLAWKGGRLGRTDPSQRWDAREDRPGEFCEPCGHTPMCAVCMEWDLQAWQQERGKTFADLVCLLALRSYLSQVAGRPEYYAVAATYWAAHWDGWHNRNAPG